MTGESDVVTARREGYCPACGYQTLPEGEPGTYLLCPVCYWEDETYPLEEPETVLGGANGSLSLAEARRNVLRFGDKRDGGSDYTRPPTDDEPRHPAWPFSE